MTLTFDLPVQNVKALLNTWQWSSDVEANKEVLGSEIQTNGMVKDEKSKDDSVEYIITSPKVNHDKDNCDTIGHEEEPANDQWSYNNNQDNELELSDEGDLEEEGGEDEREDEHGGNSYSNDETEDIWGSDK